MGVYGFFKSPMLRAAGVIRRASSQSVEGRLPSSAFLCVCLFHSTSLPSLGGCCWSRVRSRQTIIKNSNGAAFLLARRCGSATGRVGKAKGDAGASKGKAKIEVNACTTSVAPPRAKQTPASSRQKLAASLPNVLDADEQLKDTDTASARGRSSRKETASSAKNNTRDAADALTPSSPPEKRASLSAFSSSGRAQRLAAAEDYDDADEAKSTNDGVRAEFSELSTEDPIGGAGADNFGAGGDDPERMDERLGGNSSAETLMDGFAEVEGEASGGGSRRTSIGSLKASAVHGDVGDDFSTGVFFASEDGEQHPADATPVDEEVANRYLAVAFPQLAAEYAAVGDSVNATPVSEVLTDSAVVAGWRCVKCDQVWRSAVFVRCILKNGCPQCAANRSSTLAKVRPDLLQLWDYNRNNPFLKPQEIAADSKQSVFWNCPSCRESYAARVKDRVQDKVRCPSCALLVSHSAGERASEESVVLQEWHPLKNGDLRIDQVSPTDTRTKVWWLCAGCGHEWEASLAVRLSRRRLRKKSLCPACHGKGVTELA